jgi:hypothetical protein
LNVTLKEVVEDYDAILSSIKVGANISLTFYLAINLIWFDYIVGDGQILDPFYNDKKIEKFLIFVRENWGSL